MIATTPCPWSINEANNSRWQQDKVTFLFIVYNNGKFSFFFLDVSHTYCIFNSLSVLQIIRVIAQEKLCIT